MYTRNYRQINSRADGSAVPPETSVPERADPQRQEIDEESVTELPPGYSGTALLRERTQNEADVTNETERAADDLPEPPREARHVRRYKIMRDVKRDEICDCNSANEPVNECFELKEPPPKPCLRERVFSIEDMLLSALIVLLLSEGADDVTVIILGFLLISEL